MNLGQVMVDLQGKWLIKEEQAIINHPKTGGVILFSRNYENIEQLTELIGKIRRDAKHKLLIAVDHEGGRVWRFNKGFTKIPAMGAIGKIFMQDRIKAQRIASNVASIIAAELLSCGIDLSFAPVLDLNYAKNIIIGDRAFGESEKQVKSLGKAFIEGFHRVGMAATGKHFPGHGGCLEDSHIALATDNRCLDELLAKDLSIFQELSKTLRAIMVAHIYYPKIDKHIASSSKYWLQDVLRDKFKFKGAIISDCLSMVGASRDELPLLERVRNSLLAGCDLVIVAQQNRDVLQQVLNDLSQENNLLAMQRLAALSANFRKVAIKRSFDDMEWQKLLAD